MLSCGAEGVERGERGGSKESEPRLDGADREREGVEGRESWDWREGVTGQGSKEDVELRPIRQGVVLLLERCGATVTPGGCCTPCHERCGATGHH